MISTCKNRGRGTNLRKRENKWISTGITGWGDQPREKKKTNGLVQVKQGWGTNLRKRENKWIRTGKYRGGGPILGKEKTNGLVQVKTGVEDQPKKKRKQMD